MQRLKIEVVTDDGREMVLFENDISEFSYLDAAGVIRVEAKVKPAAVVSSPSSGAGAGFAELLNRLATPKTRTEADERRAEIAGARRARAKLAQIEAEQSETDSTDSGDAAVIETVDSDTDAGDLKAV